MRSPSVAIDIVAVSRSPSRMQRPVSPLTVAISIVRFGAQNFSRRPMHQSGDAVGADDRQRCGAGLAAAVRRPGGIGREEREQRLLVARLHGRHELLQQRRLRGLGDVEALALAAHALARAVDHLPACRFAPLDHRGNLAVADVEHVVQQEGGPLLGREPLEQREEGDGEIGGQIEVAIGRRRPSRSAPAATDRRTPRARS